MSNIAEFAYPVFSFQGLLGIGVIALLILACRYIYHAMKYIHFQNDDSGTTDKMRNCTRKHQRKSVEGVRVQISDGSKFYSGLIANISPIGLCLKNVPAALSSSKALLSVIVRTDQEDIRLVARPRWETPQTNHGKTIGAEIAKSPDSWGQFVLSQ